MQELTFEQVEVVSGGGIIEDRRRAEADRAIAEMMCKVVDGALGGLLGNGIGVAVKISGYGAAAGVGAGLSFITPCADNVLACIDDAAKCPVAPEGYIGGPHQPDPLL
ncbi:hypothetical protein MN202_09360 [Rheinheimera muenzenbergensis]|uniref:Uncharacterized protein n=1 Tax=Rheinheimera muenzenbergensis TaxID=1193628 RepID=A0ABU8C678_9GAMM